MYTDFSVTDQEAILLRKVHPDTHEPVIVFATSDVVSMYRFKKIILCDIRNQKES
jgi:hypothetical protein